MVPTPDHDQRAGRVGGTADRGAHEFAGTAASPAILPGNVGGNPTQLLRAPIPFAVQRFAGAFLGKHARAREQAAVSPIASARTNAHFAATGLT
ncbi:MAG: hypothetical protein IPK27_09955 [Rhodanobacteraceae bacterium]|nr:hypothetical protein [Rhodanobacteraceae bacterium]